MPQPSAALYNPLAPRALQGLGNGAPPGYVDADFTYVFDVAMVLGQTLENQTIAIETDSDFLWRAFFQWSQASFGIRLYDANGYAMSNGYINNANLLNTGAAPYPIIPESFFPAGGRITFDLENLGLGANQIQLAFRGVKRYRVP